jgi:hypothetical protein
LKRAYQLHNVRGEMFVLLAEPAREIVHRGDDRAGMQLHRPAAAAGPVEQRLDDLRALARRLLLLGRERFESAARER